MLHLHYICVGFIFGPVLLRQQLNLIIIALLIQQVNK
jgi:hypothetical protein